MNQEILDAPKTSLNSDELVSQNRTISLKINNETKTLERDQVLKPGDELPRMFALFSRETNEKSGNYMLYFLFNYKIY